MSRQKVAVFGGTAAGVLATALLLLWPGPGDDRLAAPLPAPPGVDLGFSYLPLTSRVSAYYGLGMDSGALVTEVDPGSPAARAGVVVGDIILSFNGVSLGEATSLLGMVIACPVGHAIEMEVWRVGGVSMVTLSHTEAEAVRGDGCY
ncbi:MAG: PDZ domain-containing protein [Chloroflexi bacterium]|nr:PDZ domain-containing protein [Chloroflexota bacterium]